MGARIEPIPCLAIGETTPRHSEIRALRPRGHQAYGDGSEAPAHTLRHPSPAPPPFEALDTAFDPFPALPRFDDELAGWHDALAQLSPVAIDDDPTLPRAYSDLLDGVAERLLRECAWTVPRDVVPDRAIELEEAFPLVSTKRRPCALRRA